MSNVPQEDVLSDDRSPVEAGEVREAEGDERHLREIFVLHNRYNACVYAGREAPPEEAFPEFVQSWRYLPPDIRTQAEGKYRRGYENVIRDAVEEMQGSEAIRTDELSQAMAPHGEPPSPPGKGISAGGLA